MRPLTKNPIEQLLAILSCQKNREDLSTEVSWLRTQAPKSKCQVHILCPGESCLDLWNLRLLLCKIWVTVALSIQWDVMRFTQCISQRYSKRYFKRYSLKRYSKRDSLRVGPSTAPAGLSRIRLKNHKPHWSQSLSATGHLEYTELPLWEVASSQIRAWRSSVCPWVLMLFGPEVINHCLLSLSKVSWDIWHTSPKQ